MILLVVVEIPDWLRTGGPFAWFRSIPVVQRPGVLVGPVYLDGRLPLPTALLRPVEQRREDGDPFVLRLCLACACLILYRDYLRLIRHDVLLSWNVLLHVLRRPGPKCESGVAVRPWLDVLNIDAGPILPHL